MFTANQIVAHLVGDYLLQTNQMATEKTEPGAWGWYAAVWHGFAYVLPFFLFLGPSYLAVAVIFGTHVIIDHYRLVNYIWKPSSCQPDYISFWVMVIRDNTIHVLINGAALAWL